MTGADVLAASRGPSRAAIGVGLALLASAVAVRSPQAGAVLALLVLLVAVRAHSRDLGLLLLWGYWLLTPFVRRLLDLVVEAPGSDPLSVLPFLATLALAAMEIRNDRLDRRARTVLGLAALGILFGLPAGMGVDPAAASFAALAYVAGLSALVLGWGDGIRSGRGSSLEKALFVALIPLAIYAILQYFFPLAEWDAQWVDSGELASLGAPQEDHIRVFSTLNAPFTFAIVLVAGILLSLGRQRDLRPVLLSILPLVLALALTFVRSAWLALVVGLLVFAAAARGRAALQVVTVVAVCMVGLLAIGEGNPTTGAFTERVTSLGNPEEDVSTQSRLRTTNRLLSESVTRPLGAGIGQAGLAVRLEESDDGGPETVDNGYLALLYQSGPFGLLLVVAALIGCLAAAVRALRRGPPGDRRGRAALLATFVMLLVALASADVFFGLPGAVLWYLGGLALALAAQRHPPDIQPDSGPHRPSMTAPAVTVLRPGGR